ncbi:MAG: cupin domain-containing protein [Acidobacteria bacterium]|nr:cupin domain-containing protein [Acidobacteriota bacterium]MDA1236774.1 cupin domain-containing protein [Acidobacteriota bacterium]
MKLSRRELTLLFPALAAAQSSNSGGLQPSLAYPFEDQPVRANGERKSRQILNGKTHSGFLVELHSTELPPGEMPHPAHRHVHEEMFFMRTGTMEVTIEGRATRLTPGSVAYIASNELHGVKNVGTTKSEYFVMALGERG